MDRNEITLKRKITELEMRIEQLESQLSAMKTAGSKPYYSIKEYADIMQITPQTVYNRIYSGNLTAIKVGGSWRISASTIGF